MGKYSFLGTQVMISVHDNSAKYRQCQNSSDLHIFFIIDRMNSGILEYFLN